MSRPLLVSSIYLVCMAALIYGLSERQVGYGHDVASTLLLVSLGVLHIATGAGVARWWAIALPALAVLLAVPAGYPDSGGGEPWPIWMGLAFWSPVLVILIAVGVAIASVRWDRRHAARN